MQTLFTSAGDQAERRFEWIIGNSAPLEAVLDQVEQVASTDSTVLIEGETGPGKELIANAIHNAGQRFGGSFIKLNCPAIPLNLLESELFGHEKGAFTVCFWTKPATSRRRCSRSCCAYYKSRRVRAFKERSHSQSGCSVGGGNQSGPRQDGHSRSILQ